MIQLLKLYYLRNNFQVNKFITGAKNNYFLFYTVICLTACD